MEDIFDVVLSHYYDSKPQSILLLCDVSWKTSEAFRRYLNKHGIKAKCTSNGARFEIGTLLVTIQYVRSSDNWLECLRGTAFNQYYSLCYLSDYQQRFVESRINNDWNWMSQPKGYLKIKGTS